jgi:hypothetical protein
MLLTVYLAHPTMPLQVQVDLPETEAQQKAEALEQGGWVELNFPPGSPDHVRVNPAFVTHVQLVS